MLLAYHCRYGYERDLLRLLEQHIRDMDKKIAKAKERAEKESAPRELKAEEKARLTEIQTKVKGESGIALSLKFCATKGCLFLRCIPRT